MTPKRSRKLSHRLDDFFKGVIALVCLGVLLGMLAADPAFPHHGRDNCTHSCVERVKAKKRAEIHKRTIQRKRRLVSPYATTLLRIGSCESGNGGFSGDYLTYPPNWSINTGNGYYGGLQFSLSSWQAVGGQGYPHNATRLEQMYRAVLLMRQQGWNAWPNCRRAASV